MIKKLVKHGNSRAIILDRGVLDLLKINDETPLDISTDGKLLIISPVREKKRRKKFEEGLEYGNKKYGSMLKRLGNK
ncbi:MAG: AbrB/MazE/SpoVT family DNA-binding domain-containing protein [Nitrospinota bacterium]